MNDAAATSYVRAQDPKETGQPKGKQHEEDTSLKQPFLFFFEP